MIPQRIQLKFYVTNPEMAVLDRFIDVFHGWIQEKKISDTLLIDVADYQHVPNGPGVILIGLEADYGMDEVGRLGLLYTRKRAMADSFAQSLHIALGQALAAAKLIQAETDVRFGFDVIEIIVADKLAAPNTDTLFNQLSGDVVNLFAATLDKQPHVAVERVDNDPRLPLQFRVVLPDTTTIDSFLIDSAAIA